MVALLSITNSLGRRLIKDCVIVAILALIVWLVSAQLAMGWQYVSVFSVFFVPLLSFRILGLALTMSAMYSYARLFKVPFLDVLEAVFYHKMMLGRMKTEEFEQALASKRASIQVKIIG